MNSIKSKLRSQRGASIIIAMVFMLFCVFVGGAVLTAATANGGRERALTVEQQEFLNQRSLVGVLSDEMKAPGGSKNRVTIRYVVSTKQPIRMLPGGGTEPDPTRTAIKEYNVGFEVYSDDAETRSKLREIVFESAVQRYIAENYTELYGSHETSMTFTKFGKDYGNFYVSLDGTDYAPLSVNISDPLGKASYQAKLICLGDDSDEAYTFEVSFAEDVTLNLHLQARVSTSEYESPPDVVEGADGYYEQTSVTYTTFIDWSNPEVVKGGA